MIYNSKVDLVNDYVYTKFGLNRSIRFQDIEQKLNSDFNQGPSQLTKNVNGTFCFGFENVLFLEFFRIF